MSTHQIQPTKQTRTSENMSIHHHPKHEPVKTYEYPPSSQTQRKFLQSITKQQQSMKIIHPCMRVKRQTPSCDGHCSFSISNVGSPGISPVVSDHAEVFLA